MRFFETFVCRLLLFLLPLLLAPATLANDSGIFGYSGNPATEGGEICNLCHTGGVTPTVTLTGPSVVDGGNTYAYTLTVAGGQATACGLDVSATGGTLEPVDADTRLWSGEITHDDPRLVDGAGECVFSFDWVAPIASGMVTLHAAGNSVNLDVTTAGDQAGQDALAITVNGAPPGQIPPIADGDGPYAALVGEQIVFDGSGSHDSDGSIVSYDWDFGDQAVGSGVAPSHAFSQPGAYVVTLTVTDDDGFTDTDQTLAQVLAEPGSIRAIRVSNAGILGGNAFIAAPPGDPRIFAVRQGTRVDGVRKGQINIIQPDGSANPVPFLEVDSCCDGGAETGLRGLAFPPDYATSGLFYVVYLAVADGATVLARYKVSNDPDLADPASGEVILSIPQTSVAHNGSHIQFGPDGYLYFGTGDDNVDANASDDGNLRGKILRLDVSGGLGSGYSIPPDNPFVGAGDPLDEIWAKGLRNPYVLDFDPLTGDLYIADVGQGSREEVNVEPAVAFGGANYGWPNMEGFRCRGGSPACTDGTLELPVYEYHHEEGRCAIIGGAVYRGVISDLEGRYFFADYCSDEIWSFVWDGAGGVVGVQEHTTELIPNIGQISSITAIQPDGFGETLILDRSGEIFRVLSTDPDTDGDFVPNAVDNCIWVFNRGQADADGDGLGDDCDRDCEDGVDNDGDGLIDDDDPQCASSFLERPLVVCGLGYELSLVLLLIGWLRRRLGRPSGPALPT